jgi:hypothetical protein
LYYRQQLRALTPVGGPTGGGTSITILGEGFESFDGEAATARCKFDYGGVVTIGPVTAIGSDGELACTVPRARFGGETSVMVALNGMHFVGATTDTLVLPGEPVPDAPLPVAPSSGATPTTTSGGAPAGGVVDGGTVGLSFLCTSRHLDSAHTDPSPQSSRP